MFATCCTDGVLIPPVTDITRSSLPGITISTPGITSSSLSGITSHTPGITNSILDRTNTIIGSAVGGGVALLVAIITTCIFVMLISWRIGKMSRKNTDTAIRCSYIQIAIVFVFCNI